MGRFAYTDGGHGDVDVDFTGNYDDDAPKDQAAGFVEYGPLDVREKMRDANAVMRAADEEITKAKGAPKDFVKQWTLVWVAWNRFWDRFQLPPGIVAQMRDTTYKRADEFVRTAQAFLNGLRDKTYLKTKIQPAPPATLKQVPGVARGKAGKPGKDGAPGAPATGWAWWQWGLLVGVVGGGGYAAYRLWPKKKKAAELGAAEGTGALSPVPPGYVLVE